jgi:transposase InsO family protein
VPRPLVPAAYRQKVFAAMHAPAHPGIRASKRLISRRFVWPGLSRDVANFCRDCIQCSQSKVYQHVKSPVQPIELPPRRFAHLHVDLVGPFPASASGSRYLFTIIDRSTRWVEAAPLPDMTVGSCAAALFTHWISRYGVPDLLTSDRGAQFSSEVWQSICTRLGIVHRMTTAYHPQANGMVERFHRQLKEALRARLAAAAADWETQLPWVMLGIRAAPKDDCGVSAAEAVFGQALVLPGQFLASSSPAVDAGQPSFSEQLKSDLVSFCPLPLRERSYADVARAVPSTLLTAPFVYIRRDGVAPALSSRYEGPYKVISTTPKYFRVAIGSQSVVVSVDRLKPHLGTAPVTPPVPPRRGRPSLAAA